MKFFKCAAYVLFTIMLCNLGFNAYMFRELKKSDVIITSDPAVQLLRQESAMRDTQLLQGILMIHHDRSIHQPGSQQMCPVCEAIKQNGQIVKK